MGTTVVDASDTEGIKRALRGMKPQQRTQNGGGRRPVDSETRKRIEAMARTGEHSRNAVAREFGVSPSTVTRICREATPPITFDRTATAVAVEAQVTDMKARRARLAEGMLDDVDKIRGMLFTDQRRVHMSVTNGEQEFWSPPSPGELRDLLTATGIAIDKHLVLVREDSDDRDLPAVEVFLRGQGVPSLFGG